MPTPAEEWQTAWIIAEEYGADGVGFAAQMAESFRIGGRLEPYRSWVSIMQKIGSLTATPVPTSADADAPLPGEMVSARPIAQ